VQKKPAEKEEQKQGGKVGERILIPHCRIGHKFITAITGGGKTQAIKNLVWKSRQSVLSFGIPDNDPQL